MPEIELRNQRERVAELRRQLPQGPAVQDYAFEEVAAGLDVGDSPIRTVRLSQLFTEPTRSVVLYHFMYGKKQTKPCPMCTAWIGGFNGVAHHLAQSVDFAIVAAADLSTLRSHARERGWNRLRLLTAASSTFKYDLGSEDKEGNQDSTISVFTRDSDGTIRHSYSGIRGWRAISRNAASMSWRRCGTCWTSLDKAAATFMQSSNIRSVPHNS